MLIFDYTKAMAQVKELRLIASDMSKMRNSVLNNAINGVQNGWQGQTATEFLKKCDELNSIVLKEIGNIEKLADSLEHTSNAIQQAELKAKRILQENILRSK